MATANTGKRQGGNGGRNTKREGAKVLPFRREISLNLGVIIFLFILLYLIVSLVRSATREPYSSFEVGREDTLSEARSYRALILRSEQVISSRWAGYVDLFAPESGHVSVSSVVTSVDEIGSYSQKIKSVAELQSLSNEELRNFKTRLQKLSLSYSGDEFTRVYEARDSIGAFFSTHIGKASLEVLEDNAFLNEFFHVYKSDTSGLVLYYRDGFESKKPETLTAEDFENRDYQRESAQKLVSLGDFLYKLVDSENWSLFIPLDAEGAARYGAVDSLTITFLKNGLRTTAGAQVINGGDGSLMLRLDLNRYLVQFATDRFTEIRIENQGASGLKIPASCRVEENAYLIPREYETILPDGSTDGFYQEIRRGSETTVRHILPRVFRRDDTYCYVSREDVPAESILIKQNSQDRYTVRLTTSLVGVYQINTGYTVFCPIEILEESGEYLLVERGTPHGISTFDKILLNASRYNAGQILR